MNQQGGSLVHDDVLAKMDTLLKKHHDALARGAVAEDFPILTEVVKEAKEAVETFPVLTEVVEIESETMTFTVLEPDEPPLPDVKSLPLSGEALSQLDRQIQEILEQRLSSHMVAAMDKALAAMLDQFAVQLEHLVRDAVAQELQHQLTELLRHGGHGDASE